jgi:hypothetical protein
VDARADAEAGATYQFVTVQNGKVVSVDDLRRWWWASGHQCTKHGPAAPPPQTDAERDAFSEWQATTHDRVGVLRHSWLYGMLQDPRMAFFYTREPDLTTLHAEFNYYNADSAMEMLTSQESRRASPRKPAKQR